ncbi:MAG: phenylalanine--tRNA ligase subunit beta, partial [Caldisericaceae bacterium]
IVDITNLVAKKYGQPLHAFDFDKLQGKIIVRTAKEGEKLRTLDGVHRNLNTSNLLITDLSGPIAIAGVMGGEATAVTQETRNVFIESAYFDPMTIAYSSRSIGLITDASALFEKGVDSSFQSEASRIAAALIKKEAGGSVSSERITGKHIQGKVVEARFQRISSYLGEQIPENDVKKYLEYEGLEFDEKTDSVIVRAPAFRQDINIEEDVIEEVFRMKGYNELEESTIVSPVRSGGRSEQGNFLLDLKSFLVEYGLLEVSTFSLLNPQLINQTSKSPEEEWVRLMNPLSEDMNILRPSLLPMVYQVLKRNLNVGASSIAIFELDTVFNKIGQDYKERTELVIILKGERLLQNGFKKHLPYDFYYLKGILEDVFERFNIQSDFERKHFPYLHPYQSSAIYCDGEEIGHLGRLSKDLDKEAYFASVDVDILMKLSGKARKFKAFSLYPSVKRDIAVVVNEDVDEIEVRKAILSNNIKELIDVKLFDLYRGAPIPDGKKNLAYSLEFSSQEKTFRSEEIDEFISQIERSINTAVKGELRRK